ncbi:MAG: DUF1178 family protein [Pseudomonadota bacterium]
MIKYRLKCAENHQFDSWFASAEAFDMQKERGLVTCAICGTDQVEKAIMAPSVAVKDEAPLSQPQSPAEAALQTLRHKIETESDYVGKDFANEARRIHLGESEARGIWGEANQQEAKALHDEGIPVAPIPFMRRADS